MFKYLFLLPKKPDPKPNFNEEKLEKASYGSWTLSKLREAYAHDEISFEDLEEITELVLLEAINPHVEKPPPSREISYPIYPTSVSLIDPLFFNGVSWDQARLWASASEPWPGHPAPREYYNVVLEHLKEGWVDQKNESLPSFEVDQSYDRIKSHNHPQKAVAKREPQ